MTEEEAIREATDIFSLMKSVLFWVQITGSFKDENEYDIKLIAQALLSAESRGREREREEARRIAGLNHYLKIPEHTFSDYQNGWNECCNKIESAIRNLKSQRSGGK